MSKRFDHRGTFECRGIDGQLYVVEHWVDVICVSTRGDPNGEIDGQGELLCDGRHVNYVEKGHYRTLGGMDVKTDDPAAP